MTGREDIFQKAMIRAIRRPGISNGTSCRVHRKALAEFPDHPKALTSLGLALFELQHYEEALQAYIRAAQVSSNDPCRSKKPAQLSERIGSIGRPPRPPCRAADFYIKK